METKVKTKFPLRSFAHEFLLQWIGVRRGSQEKALHFTAALIHVIHAIWTVTQNAYTFYVPAFYLPKKSGHKIYSTLLQYTINRALKRFDPLIIINYVITSLP